MMWLNIFMRLRLGCSFDSGEKGPQTLALLPRFNQTRAAEQTIENSRKHNCGIGRKIGLKPLEIGVLDGKIKLRLREQ